MRNLNQLTLHLLYIGWKNLALFEAALHNAGVLLPNPVQTLPATYFRASIFFSRSGEENTLFFPKEEAPQKQVLL